MTAEHNHAYLMEMLESAWGIIANAGGGDWDLEKLEWQDAAVRWRDHYHRLLASQSKPSDYNEEFRLG